MLLGLPAHLAPAAVGDSVSRACHAIAATVLAAAAALLLTKQAVTPDLLLWPALVSLVPLVVLLVVVERTRSTTAHLAYLIVGTAALYWYAVTLFSQVAAVQASDAFSLSLPKIALIMVGSTAVGPRRGLLWSTAGYAAGELATQLATWHTGASLRLDVTALLAFVLVAVVTGHAEASRGRAREAQPRLHRAALEQQVQGIRVDIEQQAAALVHDTILGHLAALATARPGPLSPEIARSIAADLEVLVGRDWLSPGSVPPEVAVRAADAWERSRLHEAVERSRSGGLEVAVTGDVSAVGRLDPVTGDALGLAVAQCLVNVNRHSGADRAELVVFGDGTDLTVMVIDDGVGFDTAAVAPDRPGLTASVEARLARVGGPVPIWSSPGSGPSIVLRVPFAVTAPVVVADDGVPA
ncbi:sensor histidine kinase [Frigoribacterium sp. RIT-PI-h]|uniref:sensor histidine kinase n=1 Tax=Frigoribacterium sp. RIT-PI-h TaxID=1690245 RepID=UPI0006B94DC8|nr:ATP-binding protein [Frigoribacterium sp. RIT-PI-h]KPG81395.1 hypothetical protein AEQ27_10985 [Frigoribacterium sp. RIT-PI-h]